MVTDTKKQEIQEMKSILDKAYRRNCKSCHSCQYYSQESCREAMYAEALYNAGYRKKGENGIENKSGKE